MRFFHLVNVRWYNATAWYGLNLCRLLQAAGHEVIVGVLPGTETAIKAKEMGLSTLEDDFTAKNPFAALAVIGRVNRFLEGFRPENITCHRGEFFWYFALKRYFSKPAWSLIRVRGDERRPKNNWPNRFLHNSCADRVIVSGEFIKRWFVGDLGMPETKIAVIHGGVDSRKFAFDAEGRKRVRSEFGFAENDIVAGLVGRYCPVKGHAVLMEAISLLRQRDPRYKLLMITDSGSLDVADLKEKVAKSDLKDHAFVTGFRPDVVACMSALDVGVVASLGSEAICRVAFELMAVGVPLVSTAVGSLPEIAPKNNLVPPGDATALAHAIQNADKTLRVFDDTAFLQAYLRVCQKGIL